ncbi:hypothetical protein D9758_008380 [Tetrapyrgos nigripes]|uniref:Uncharacterized protein n=1 Tax=Tetrapyrgos nigripes TaxID=182062 RepID=A0A8H5GDV5_9AGAR|nr:hypothetical protein D9758_008380 [Tetrapyrgos nigripes]
MTLSYPLEWVSTNCDPETTSLKSILLIPLDGQTSHDDLNQRLANMEYSWGLEKGELDLVTSLNTIRVYSDIVEKIADHSIALVPTESTMKTMQDISLHNSRCSLSSRQRYTTLSPQPPVFEYNLLPLTITSTIYVRPPESKSVQRYFYPYDDLPLFHSTGHPFHVVYNSIGSVLPAPPNPYVPVDPSLIRSISLLSNLWQHPAPDEFMEGPNWSDSAESEIEFSSLRAHDGGCQNTNQNSNPNLNHDQCVKHGPRRHRYLRNTALKRIDSWRKNVDTPLGGHSDEGIGVLNSMQLGRYEFEPPMRFRICRGTMALAMLGASVSSSLLA